ncbi:nicotinate-nucleotide adenylyltransferase [Thalassotalea maritima]|uniref:nicotinate-nucleotide adenylyltransferase n=1 Tax=Thalassotalea maritima TaxID=3242416 RepID=UPI0035285227
MTSNLNETLGAQRLGIFGGTFDPIHLGHILPCEDLANALTLSHVLLMPAHLPPHKSSTHANAEQRLQMTRLVAEQNPLFVVDARELQRHEPSYTVNSIKELKQQYPTAQLFFFIGTDSLLSLHTWYQIDELFTLCHFVVSTRPGYNSLHVDETIKHRITRNINDVNHLAAGQILMVETRQVDISSTQIRQQLLQKQNCQRFLPSYIADYIEQNQLYQR